jgi:hypothetical protein
MKITKVVSSGVDKLIDAYRSAGSDRTSFSTKAYQFFENIEIDLYISDVKGIELLMLRKFCGSIFILNTEKAFTSLPSDISKSVLSFDHPSTQAEQTMIDNLNNLSNSLRSYYRLLLKDNSEIGHDGYGMFDCGSLRFKIVARFIGVNIVPLLDAFPDSTLWSKKLEDFVDPNTPDFDNLCVKKFIQNFFDFVESNLSAVDIMTDVKMQENFFYDFDKDADEKVRCTEIRTPLMIFDMSKLNSVQDMTKAFDVLRGEMNYNGISNFKNIDDEITFHFAIHGSMETLIAFHAYSNLVYYYKDLKAVIGVASEYKVPEQIHAFQEIYAEAVSALDNYRLNTLKELTAEEKSSNKNKKVHFRRLELYEFMPRTAKTSFMIRGTKHEILNLLNHLEGMNEAYSDELKNISTNIKKSITLVDYFTSKLNM